MSNDVVPIDPQALSPAKLIDTGSPHDSGIPEPGMALCLSGGGYRAMLFHVGTLWRLNELGYLSKLKRISSVSGGSITAGVLGLKWESLSNAGWALHQFQQEVVDPIRKLAGRTIDEGAIIWGALGPGSIGDRVIQAYGKYLFGSATLQDLPWRPTFVINATNVQTGSLWRFMKQYMADYQVGRVESPHIPLALAVAASSAFPPFLSPVQLELEEADYLPSDSHKFPKIRQDERYKTNVVLTDGGVYDNLGLETAWKNYDTILISDGGGHIKPEPEPKFDWAQHAYRIFNLVDNQVRSLRKRQVIESYKLRKKLLLEGVNPESESFKRVTRQGAYWSIRSHIEDYKPVSLPLECPPDKTIKLAEVPTRLKALDSETQERLINWGYAICDVAMRKHVDSTLPEPNQFPYPGGVG
jgi:NTE family protein